MNINWKDNIHPDLSAGCSAAAAKAFQNMQVLIEGEKKRRCISGDTNFVVAFSKNFFKGLALSAQCEVLKLMEDEGYTEFYIYKKHIFSWLTGPKVFHAYVPTERYHEALSLYHNNSNSVNAAITYLTGCNYKNVSWYK